MWFIFQALFAIVSEPVLLHDVMQYYSVRVFIATDFLAARLHWHRFYAKKWEFRRCKVKNQLSYSSLDLLQNAPLQVIKLVSLIVNPKCMANRVDLKHQ